MDCRVISRVYVFILVLSFTFVARAQNVDRLEEEAIKDKEKDVKIEQLIEMRKEEQEKILNAPLSDEDLQKKNLVEVEPNNVLPSDLGNIYALVPYKVRRPRWGHQLSFTYSQYHPVNYQTDYLSSALGTYDSLYGKSTSPMLEFGYSYKYNFAPGSLGLDLAYGNYSNTPNSYLLGDAKLSLQVLRAGARYTMDNWLYEPYIAPYFLGGVYEVIYKETQGGASLDGTTQAAPYWGVGVLLQLNWIDPAATIEAYTESGIENTFLYIDGRQYLASNASNDPDFSTGVDLNFGLALEF